MQGRSLSHQSLFAQIACFHSLFSPIIISLLMDLCPLADPCKVLGTSTSFLLRPDLCASPEVPHPLPSSNFPLASPALGLRGF